MRQTAAGSTEEPAAMLLRGRHNAGSHLVVMHPRVLRRLALASPPSPPPAPRALRPLSQGASKLHAMRRPRVACVLVILALVAMAWPSYAAAVEAVSDEAGLRAAVNDSSVSEVVVTADVNLTAGHLTVPPGRVLTLRGACGVTNATPCTLDANHLSRHLHVTPGADVRVSNLHLVNGAAMSTECSPRLPPFFGPVVLSSDGCAPQYYGFGVWLGLLNRIPGLAAALNNPTWGDAVSQARTIYVSSPTARSSLTNV